MKYWWLILVLIVVVGCTDTPAMIDECEEQTAISMHDACYQDTAIEKGEYKYCELMYFNSVYCLHKVAVKTNNIDLCNISWASDTCYYKVALNTNNYDYCELLTEEKTNCSLEIAKQTKDSAKCAELNETC
jgi:hypothetical protein